MSRTRNRSITDMSDMSDRARLNRIIDFCQNHAAAPPPDERALPFEPDNDGCTEHWVDLLIRLAERGLEAHDEEQLQATLATPEPNRSSSDPESSEPGWFQETFEAAARQTVCRPDWRKPPGVVKELNRMRDSGYLTKSIVRLGHGTDEHPPSEELVQALETAWCKAAAVAREFGIDNLPAPEIHWLVNAHIVRLGEWNIWAWDDHTKHSPADIVYYTARTAFYQAMRGDFTDTKSALWYRMNKSRSLWGIVDE